MSTAAIDCTRGYEPVEGYRSPAVPYFVHLNASERWFELHVMCTPTPNQLHVLVSLHPRRIISIEQCWGRSRTIYILHLLDAYILGFLVSSKLCVQHTRTSARMSGGRKTLVTALVYCPDIFTCQSVSFSAWPLVGRKRSEMCSVFYWLNFCINCADVCIFQRIFV